MTPLPSCQMCSRSAGNTRGIYLSLYALISHCLQKVKSEEYTILILLIAHIRGNNLASGATNPLTSTQKTYQRIPLHLRRSLRLAICRNNILQSEFWSRLHTCCLQVGAKVPTLCQIGDTGLTVVCQGKSLQVTTLLLQKLSCV